MWVWSVGRLSWLVGDGCAFLFGGWSFALVRCDCCTSFVLWVVVASLVGGVCCSTLVLGVGCSALVGRVWCSALVGGV